MWAAWTGAAIAALAGIPHCVGMCGGFALGVGGRRDAAAWHAGRVTTYVTLGALAGALGSALPGAGPVAGVVSTVLLVWFAAGIAGWAPAIHPPRWLATRASSLLKRSGLGARFAFGLVNGLLPCGLVHAALAIPIAARDPVIGASTMLVFGLCTSPALALARSGVTAFLGRYPWGRPVLAAAVLAGGLFAVALRAPPTPDGTPACHHPVGETAQVGG